jgi:hypothetical protein
MYLVIVSNVTNVEKLISRNIRSPGCRRSEIKF